MLAEIYLLRLKMMVQATAWPAALALDNPRFVPVALRAA